MGDLAISQDDLQAVLQIINDLTVGSDCTRDLDDAIAKIAALVPFEKCVLLHERKAESHTTALMYEKTSTCPAGSRRGLPVAGALRISADPKCLRKTHTFQNAFAWHGTMPGESRSDTELATLFDQHGVSHGVAGTIDSFGDQCDSVTMMHLQFPDEQFAAKHLVFVNSIVFHVHSYFRRCIALQPAPVRRLTSKEREVLQWVMEGKTSWEVGRILAVSERTVKFHLRNIYSKLNVVNRAQAVTMASRLRLI